MTEQISSAQMDIRLVQRTQSRNETEIITRAVSTAVSAMSPFLETLAALMKRQGCDDLNFSSEEEKESVSTSTRTNPSAKVVAYELDNLLYKVSQIANFSVPLFSGRYVRVLPVRYLDQA